MNPILQANQFFVKEHVGMFKAANNFDILDPASGQVVLHCREPNLGFFAKMFRFTEYKRMTPFEVAITTPQGQPVVTVKRGIPLLRSHVEVLDERGQVIGTFRQKLLSIGGAFDILDTAGQVMCTLKGKWTSWEFKFMAGERELAQVSKKWSGLGKELFTSADNYMLTISPQVGPDDKLRQLIIAAVMCIDMVLKE